MTDIDALRRLLAEATPQPWRSNHDHDFPWCEINGPSFATEEVAGQVDDPDAVLIVAAVNGLPGLLSEIERLRAALKPFAEARTGASVFHKDSERVWVDANGGTSGRDILTVGDFRRAATALKGEA